MIYENVQIGNFLIGLGYALRGLNRKLYGSINLYQQTPNDPKTGDVFGTLNGRFFILEFKRDKANLADELKKETKQNLVASLRMKSNRHLVEISFKSHLMLSPSWLDKELYYDTLPYLLAVKLLEAENPFSKISSGSDFVSEIFDGTSIGCSAEEMRQYIVLLARCLQSANAASGVTNTSTKNTGSFGGLIFCVSPEKEEVQTMQFHNLNELIHDLSPHLSIHVGLEPRHEVLLKIDRDRNQGQGFGIQY